MAYHEAKRYRQHQGTSVFLKPDWSSTTTAVATDNKSVPVKRSYRDPSIDDVFLPCHVSLLHIQSSLTNVRAPVRCVTILWYTKMSTPSPYRQPLHSVTRYGRKKLFPYFRTRWLGWLETGIWLHKRVTVALLPYFISMNQPLIQYLCECSESAWVGSSTPKAGRLPGYIRQSLPVLLTPPNFVQNRETQQPLPHLLINGFVQALLPPLGRLFTHSLFLPDELVPLGACQLARGRCLLANGRR